MTSGDDTVECKSEPAPPAASVPPPAASPASAVQSPPPKAENKKKKPEKKGRTLGSATTLADRSYNQGVPSSFPSPWFLFPRPTFSVPPAAGAGPPPNIFFQFNTWYRIFDTQWKAAVSASWRVQDEWRWWNLSRFVFLVGFLVHELQMESLSKKREHVSTFQLHIESVSLPMSLQVDLI